MFRWQCVLPGAILDAMVGFTVSAVPREVLIRRTWRLPARRATICPTLQLYLVAVCPIYTDPVLLGYPCGPLPYERTCPHDAVMNYVGRTDNWPNYSSDDLAALTTASPHNYLHPGMPPLFILMSSEDSLGIPTSTGIAAWSYYMDGTLNTHEININGGLIPGLQALFRP